MDKVDVFTQANVPTHLAVNGERPDVEKDFRSVCGKNTSGMTVQNVTLPVNLSCEDCKWQLEQWLKKANNHPDWDD